VHNATSFFRTASVTTFCVAKTLASQSEGTGTGKESGEQAPRLLPLVRFQLRGRRCAVPQIRCFLQTRLIMSHTQSLPKVFFFFMFWSHF